MSDGFRHVVLSGLRWSAVAQVGRELLRFTIAAILARLLTPAEYGLFAMILVYTGFANVFADLGLSGALVQAQKLEQAHLNAVFWLNVGMGILLTLLMVAASPVLAWFYGEATLQPVAALLGVNFLLGSFTLVHRALLQRRLAFRAFAVVDMLAMGLAGAAAIAAAQFGLSVFSLVIQTLVLSSVSAVLLWRLSGWRPDLSFELGALRELRAFSTNLLGFGVVNYWSRNLDNLLLAKYAGSVSVGLYGRAYNLMLLPISQVTNGVSMVMLPALSSIQQDIERVRRLYLQFSRTIAFLTFPLMVGLVLVAKPFVLLLYGPGWAEVVPLLQVLGLAGIGQSVSTTVGWLYYSQGRTDLLFRWGIVSALVYAVAFVVGLQWGVLGVAVAYTVCGYVVLWYPAWVIPGRLVRLSFRDMMGNLSAPFFCVAAMAAVVAAAVLLLPADLRPFWQLAIEVPLGAACYVLCAHLFRVQAYVDVRQMALAALTKMATRSQGG